MKRTHTNRGDKQMKKRTKTIIATLITLVLIPTVALAALQWRGSQNVTNIKTNLTLISQKMDTLKQDSGDKDKTIREIEILLEQQENLVKQKETELANKQKEIQQKVDEINQKNQTIDQKNGEINTKEQELQQALRDVQEIERITEEMAR